MRLSMIQRFMLARFLKCTGSTMLLSSRHSIMIPDLWLLWTKHVGNSLTVMPLPRWSLTVARVRSSWPSIFQSCFRNQAKTLKKPNLRTLNQCMIVFKYIEDKDVFQKFYSKMLAKRLVQHMSASDDAEASMISKLKQACGFEYTSKLQRMFQDIGVSKDLNENFKRHLANSGEPLDIDFSIQVLSSGSWPFQQSCVFNLPTELERCVTRFTAFYSGQHSGRKLNWLFHMSKES